MELVWPVAYSIASHCPTESCNNTGNLLGRYSMNDQRKTKKQLLEELEQERELVAREQGRTLALQEVSKKVAAAHDQKEVLDLIVNEASRLLDVKTVFLRLLEGDALVLRAVTGSLGYQEEVIPTLVLGANGGLPGQVMATKKPIFGEAVAQFRLPATRRFAEGIGIEPAAIGSVPLLANDQSIGTLTVVDSKNVGRRFTEDEISLLSAFADQAALAFEKARLLNEAEREKERSDALYQISNSLAGAHDTDEVLDLIVNEAARLVGGSGAFIRLLQEDGLVATASTKSLAEYLLESAKVLAVTEGITSVGHVMATKKPVVDEDSTESELSSPEVRARLIKHGFHARASVPMLANDQSIGVLTVMDTRIRRFTDDEVSLLAAFADQASLALEKARLLNEAETERERSDALYRVSNLLAGAHDTDVVLDLIVNEAARLIGTEYAVIRLLEGDGLVPGAATEPMKDFLALLAETYPRYKVEEGANAMGHVMATKKPLYGEEAERLATPETLRAAQEHGLQLRSSILVPLLANDRSIGVISVFDARIRQVREDDVALLSAFADQAALALEKARLLNEVEAEKARAETERERADSLYRVSNMLAGCPRNGRGVGPNRERGGSADRRCLRHHQVIGRRPNGDSCRSSFVNHSRFGSRSDNQCGEKCGWPCDGHQEAVIRRRSCRNAYLGSSTGNC